MRAPSFGCYAATDIYDLRSAACPSMTKREDRPSPLVPPVSAIIRISAVGCFPFGAVQDDTQEVFVLKLLARRLSEVECRRSCADHQDHPITHSRQNVGV